jgi:hypothetical protein
MLGCWQQLEVLNTCKSSSEGASICLAGSRRQGRQSAFTYLYRVVLSILVGGGTACTAKLPVMHLRAMELVLLY